MLSTLASTLFRDCHFGLPPQTPDFSRFSGGDDGARTRDLCRDSKSKAGNSLESGGTDGSFQRPEELLATLIAPLSHPRPLSRKPLPGRRESGGSNSGQSRGNVRSPFSHPHGTTNAH
jgi:hypothetical protein